MSRVFRPLSCAVSRSADRECSAIQLHPISTHPKVFRAFALLSILRRLLLGALACVYLTSLSACAVLGLAAHAIPQSQKAAYAGLAGQSVGVMVWADRGTRMDWENIQIDLATVVQDQLQKSKAPELKAATFPVPARQIRRYQLDYPGTEAMPITQVAPNLGVTRLIYIEIASFGTRSDASLQLFRGNAIMNLRVVEVNGNQAKVAYEEDNIRAIFPPKSPQEGIVNASDAVIYRGEVVAMAAEIVNRLTTHEVD